MSKVQKLPVTVACSSTAAAPASAPAPGPKDLAPRPDPEVSSDRPKRRRFDATYKRRILELCDAARARKAEIIIDVQKNFAAPRNPACLTPNRLVGIVRTQPTGRFF